MARNTRHHSRGKTSREPARPAPVPSCTESASPTQLQAWLKSPPSAQVAGLWRQEPWPLRRSLELDRRDLFCAWLRWGCSPLGSFATHAFPRTLVESLPDLLRTRLAQWSLEEDPFHAAELLGHFRNARAMPLLSALNWPAILGSPNMSSRIVARLATEAVLGPEGVLPTELLLRHTNGRLGSEADISSVLLRSPFPYTGQDFVDEKLDGILAVRLRALPPGLLVGFTPGHLAVKGGLCSAVALAHHLSGSPGFLDFPKVTCRDYTALFAGWDKAFPRSNGGLDLPLLSQALDVLMPCVDWRKTDRNKRAPFHAVVLPSWPEEAVDDLLSRLAQQYPAAITQRDRKGNTPATSPDTPARVKQWLANYERRNRLEKVLRHQVASTPAIKEAVAPPSDPPRRRMM